MTRKRKVEYEEEQSNQRYPYNWRDNDNTNEDDTNQQPFAGYGYQDDQNNEQSNSRQRNQDDSRVEFPKDLVTYLRNFIDLLNTNGQLDDLAWKRIVEEVKGSEEILLRFFDSCKVVENLFEHNSKAATEFLTSLFRIKHKMLLDLLFANSGARTIEKLLYTSYPIVNNQQLQVLSTLTELICDNWKDCVTEQASSFLIRCLVKILCGTAKNEKEGKFSNNSIGQEMRNMFCRIADFAIDQKILLDNPHCCLAFQDILTCDAAVQTGKCTSLIKRRLEEADGLVNSFCGKSASRIWDSAVKGCSEEIRFKLWEKVLCPNIERIALDHVGNFPLQAFMKSVRSKQLAKEVCDAMIPFIPNLMQNQLGGVISAVANCSRANEESQESLLKELRAQFNATSQKEHFFLNVLTMNKYDGENFDMQQVNGQGIYIIQALLELKKVKTLTAGILALKRDHIMQMALHKLTAYVIQAIIKSKTLSDEVKLHVFKAFENRWVELIENPIGNHTFEVVWDSPLTSIDTKCMLMKGFAQNTSKQWKFTMIRCDMNQYRKDRKIWTKKMKQQSDLSIKPPAPPATSRKMASFCSTASSFHLSELEAALPDYSTALPETKEEIKPVPRLWRVPSQYQLESLTEVYAFDIPLLNGTTVRMFDQQAENSKTAQIYAPSEYIGLQ